MADDRLYEVLGVSRYANDNEIKKVRILKCLLWCSKWISKHLHAYSFHLFVAKLHLLLKT